MADEDESLGRILGIGFLILLAIWIAELILKGLGYVALAIAAVLGLIILLIGFAPLVTAAIIWFPAGAPEIFAVKDAKLIVGGVLAAIQAASFIVGLWIHGSSQTEDLHRFLSRWLISGVFTGAVVTVIVMLIGDNQLNIVTLQVVLYSIFAFIFFFAFTSYFLIDILPWKDKHPIFNSLLAFSAAIFLSLTAAVTIYGYPGAKTAAQTVGIRLLEYLAIAMNILFASMGVWLFKKRREALRNATNTSK